MTIAEQTNRQIFTGNDANYEFSYSRTVFDIDELTVVHYDTLTDTETVLLNGTQYQIGYTGDPPYSSVTITYPLAGDPMTFDEQLIIYRNTVLSQEMDLTNQQAYFLESIETQLDRMAVINQNLQDQLNRAPLLPVSTPTWKQTFLGTPEPGTVLRWSEDPNNNVLESFDIVDMIIADHDVAELLETALEDPLFTTAWLREFGDVSGGVVNTGFNADQVDGYDVLSGTTPASGLLKVGDYGATLAALDAGAMDLDTLLSSGIYQSSTFTNAPADDDWIVDVKRASATAVKQIAYNFYVDPEVYIRNYDGNTWTDWALMWGGIGGDGSGFDADQVDGYDVDSSNIPNSGLIKAGDWGATYQTLDFSGLSADAPAVVNFNGSNMTNAPDTGAWFIQAVGDSAGLAAQSAISQTTGEVRHRFYNGSVWSSWTAAVTYDDHMHTESDVTDLDKYTQSQVDAALALKADAGLIGAVSGICPLDAGGLVDESYLPSYVDDVIEVANYAALPGTGETGKIYVALDTGNIYRWTGSAYIEINTSVATADEAIALATARSIAIGGDAAGSASFNGTANITITVNVTDSEALGGVAAASWLRSDAADDVSGVLSFSAAPVLDNAVLLSAEDTGSTVRTLAGVNGSDQAIFGNAALALNLLSSGTHTVNGDTIWTSGNDGVGSGLDADLLDGQQGSYYAVDSAVVHIAGAETVTGVINFTGTVGINSASPVADLEIDGKIRTTKTSILRAAEAFTTDNLYLIGNLNKDCLVLENTASASGSGNYGASISLIGPGGVRRSTAIASVQTTSDSDQVGLAFFTHPSTGGADPLVENMRLSPSGDLDVTGTITGSQLISDVATGTAPFSVASTTVVTNLNADTVDGVQASNLAKLDVVNEFTASQTLNTTSDSKIQLRGTSDPYIAYYENNTLKGYLRWYQDGYMWLRNLEDSSALRVKGDLDFSPDGTNFYSIYHAGNDSNLAKLDAENIFTALQAIGGTGDAKLTLSGSNNPYVRFQEGSTTRFSIGWDATYNLASLTNIETGSIIRIKDDLDFSDDNGATYNSIYHTGNDSNLAKLDAVNTFTNQLILEYNSPNIKLKELDTTTQSIINQDGGTLYIQASSTGYTGGGNIAFTGFNNTDLAACTIRYGGGHRSIYHTGNDSNLAKLDAANVFTVDQQISKASTPALEFNESGTATLGRIKQISNALYIQGANVIFTNRYDGDITSVKIRQNSTNYDVWHAGNLGAGANGTLQLPSLASDPASGEASGQIYYNATSNVVRFFNGSAWGNV